VRVTTGKKRIKERAKF